MSAISLDMQNLARIGSRGLLYRHVKYNDFVIFIPFRPFLPRDATQSAVVRLHVACPSVRPSVCNV